MLSREKSINLLYKLMLIREFEEKVSKEKAQNTIYGSVHCCHGEEAIAVGVCENLLVTDYVVSDHRPHGHAIAKGVPLIKIFAEMLERKTGCCGGRGGSMHISDVENGFLLSTGIVGSGIPVMCGAAFASKYLDEGRIACTFLGDGAANEGVFAESLNIASIYRLPALFVIEDNGLAVTTKKELTTACRDYRKLADAYDIGATEVDGQNVEDVYDITNKVIQDVRAGQPHLIIAKTIRFHEHAEGMYYYKMRDCGYRNVAALEKEVKEKCPVELYISVLKERYKDIPKEISEIREKVITEVDSAYEMALLAPQAE